MYNLQQEFTLPLREPESKEYNKERKVKVPVPCKTSSGLPLQILTLCGKYS